MSRIAFSGCANSGKSTLLKKFINRWPMYCTPAETYRDALKANNMGHSKNTSEETQTFIIDYMVNQLNENKDMKYIVYDRCPLDVLVYTLQANSFGKVSDDFVTEMVEKVKNAIELLDIIFILPFNQNYTIQDNGVRETDIEYIKETDQIFTNILHEYYNDFDSHIFFPESCPGIIPLNTENQLRDIGYLIKSNGELYSANEDKELQQSFAQSIADEKKKKAILDQLIKGQESLLNKVDVSKLKI